MSSRSFKVTSQNTQGFSGAAQHQHVSSVASGKRDFVAVQESGRVPLPNKKRIKTGLYTGVIRGPTGASALKRPRRTLLHDVHVTHLQTTGVKDGNARCSLALYSAVKPERVGTIPSGKKGVRPLLFAEFPEVMVYNSHLPSGKPKFAQRVARGFLAELEQRHMIGPGGRARGKRGHAVKPSLWVGDLNMSGAQAREVFEPFGFKVTSPAAATHEGGSTLDHAAAQRGKVSGMTVTHGTSDHSALNFEFGT